jgi:hypothetical protein
VTCPFSGRAFFRDVVTARVGRRESGRFFKRAMLFQEFLTCLPTKLSEPSPPR